MLSDIYTGNTVTFTVQPQIGGSDVEMAGSIGFILKAARRMDDEDAAIAKTSTTGIFTLTAEETSALRAGIYWYEFRWYFNDAVYTLEMGNVMVVKTIYD